MTSISLGWRPFAAHGMTQAQTAGHIVSAMAQFSRVCGVRINPGSGRTTISVRGWDGDQFAAFVHPSSNTIYVSKTRPMNGRGGRVLQMVMMHEICHCRPFSMGHTPLQPSFSQYVMHPWGSSTLWWHPAEVLRLQNRYRAPLGTWTPPTLLDIQRDLVEARKTHGPMSGRAVSLTQQYWGTVNMWRAFNLKQIKLPETPLGLVGHRPVAEIPKVPFLPLCNEGSQVELTPPSQHDGWMINPAME